ncbi:YcnI family protein (plasmid) [Roseomonas gilardii subsp. gilardii]|uniref:YcnI family copper-binding membrane protein n=1 Tax=Roseomonas gilardii TaxID=257708 RepID=UPI001FFB9E53|nr:YcnI family protein [Roseomonas gilardii]UPG74603.1 YcnI family protein [Roseomonas gilardii subsp. gilardii]
MLNRLAIAFGASLLALPAAAHVTLDQSTMPADSYLRVAIRVPHGCDGAATTGIRVQIPEGFRNVKPMPVAGWTLSLVTEGTATSGHGESAPVKEVAWQGGNLPDAFYQEFILRVQTPKEAGQTVYFPVVQDCEGGKVTRWIERPSASGGTLRAPAFAVRITPKG